MQQQASSVPQVGDPAPDFSLPSTSGSTMTLSNYRGNQNVLLIFYPKDFTSG